ncbi:MAG: hypothetical protein HZC55_08020 [Verrucomicrobia bacterium]|nr:hypothetical protein [Verrucomicrobiota bacterium]
MPRSLRTRCFCCVNDGVPPETTALLRRACRRRSLTYREVEPSTFAFNPRDRLRPGDLLYRPAISLAAQRIEQFLFTEGVLTFYADPAQIYQECLSPTLVLARAGLPIPRTEFCTTNRRTVLRAQATRLGGPPLVVKIPGGSGGVGVMKVDSLASLFSVVDYLLARREHPLLCTYVPEATHWRVIVVGDRAIAWYRSPVAPEDFRSYPTGRRADHAVRLSAAARALAVAGARALRLEFGGVDLLETAAGDTYLLEVNFPCYFPQAQRHTRTDIAVAMIDHLLAKTPALSDQPASVRRR